MQHKNDSKTVRIWWEQIQRRKSHFQLNSRNLIASDDDLPSLDDELPSLDDEPTEQDLLNQVLERFELPKDLNVKVYEKLLPFTEIAMKEGRSNNITFVFEAEGARKYAAILAAYFQDANKAIEYLEDYEVSGVESVDNHKTFLDKAIEDGHKLSTAKFPAITQLEEALINNRWDSCIWIIKNFEIDMNAIHTCDNLTIMQHAMRFPSPLQSMLLFVSRGANITTLSGTGLTVQYYAAESCRLDVLKWLDEQGADMLVKYPEGPSLLHGAVSGGYFNVHRDASFKTVQWLVEEKKLDVNYASVDGITAVHIAAEHDNTRVLDYLMKHNATVSVRDSAGRTPLQKAAAHSSWDAVQILLPYQADKNEKDINGKALLHHAAETAGTVMIRLLVSEDVDVNIADNFGATPLHYAMRNSKWDVALTLIKECGADVTKKNKSGETALARMPQNRFFPPPSELMSLLSKEVISVKHCDSTLQVGVK